MRNTLLVLVATVSVTACSKDEKARPEPTPTVAPTASAAVAKVPGCGQGGGEVSDAQTQAYFPRMVSDYCIDPKGEVRTYGDKGKYTMDEVCTTAFDGECEVYKRFGLRRVVSLHYIDNAGKGSNVEIVLSQFADAGGAFGMFTKRIIADGDPADPSTPKELVAGGAGAIGTGRAYVWKGELLVELQYNNEQESPDALTKSSATILSALGKVIGEKLPGSSILPAVKMLPPESRIANGVLYEPKDAFGISKLGAAAQGYYKDGDRRYRLAVLLRDDADQAKEAMKVLKARPGAVVVTGQGDEACSFDVVPSKDSPKVGWTFARKGAAIYGVGDEEFAMRGLSAEKASAARFGKDASATRLTSWLKAAGAAAPVAPKK